jgi:hypothetical protein
MNNPFLDNWLKSHRVDPEHILPVYAEVFSQSTITHKAFALTSAASEISPPVTKGMRTIIVVANLGANTVFVVLNAPTGASDLTAGIPLDTGDKLVIQLPFTNDGRISAACAAGNAANITVMEGRILS